MKAKALLQGFALLAGAGILTVVATFSCSTDQAMRTAVVNTQPNVAPTSQEVSIESVRLASLRSDTIAQLTAKGLPPAAPPRKKVFEQTAKLAFRKSPGVETMKMSAWNSPWLHNDPFILMAKVDASSLPTFNVLAIPSEPFEDEVIAKILDGFREKK